MGVMFRNDVSCTHAHAVLTVTNIVIWLGTNLMVVLPAAAGSENTTDGIARLRKAFL